MAKPVKTIRVGAVSISIWENKFKDSVSYSFSMSKSYYDDKTKEWKNTQSLKAQEIPLAIRALQLAYDFNYVKWDDNQSDDAAF